MPPSPALRCSPGREQRANHHRRGRSFESGMPFKEKDEDLALFNEMQLREKETFLLQSTDDLEDTFSTKLRQFSDLKLGITIPTRGESSDLLNVEGEKNDYDWLLTPPDTPLFPSLDDEPPPVNATQRGRTRSQPICISRSSTMEKSYRSSRGSASPNRLSPSPRSGNSTLQPRRRPSPVRNSSPSPSVRPATPSRRPSTPPSKSPTPPPRSCTPPPRRMSTGSSSTVTLSGTRGTSPVNTSRGNSASPKIRSWQTNIPGFSSDAPPNLRTSLADRPATYVRGSSPASRNGRDSSSNYRRQSMSPTASRSVSSSHSHDRDPFSSYSKGSVASSGDDDLDSLQSVPVGSLDRATSRRVAAFPNNRTVALSKKPAKTVSSSSAPKRSFDSALRQMDHRKGPQNMFRPLLSSVPSSTFYVGKSSPAYRPLISRNSSVTTSSNASSDLGTSVAPDTEGSDHNQDDMASELEQVPYSDVQDEVFDFDKRDLVNEDTGNDIHDGSHDIHHGDMNRGGGADFEDSGDPSITVEVSPTSEDYHVKGDFSEIDSLENMELCLKCGCGYHISDELERNIKLCPECSRRDKRLTVLIPKVTIDPENSPALSGNFLQGEMPTDAMETLTVPGSPQVIDSGKPNSSQGEENADEGQTIHIEHMPNCLEEKSLVRSVVDGGQDGVFNQKELGSVTNGCSPPSSDTGAQKLHANTYQNTRLDISEGAGISILLKRTSSSKGALVHGRVFTAATIPYDDLSYARDSSNSMRSSIGHGSFSGSSSVDFSSVRQAETRVQRQSSGKRSDTENHKHDTNMKSQSIGSSYDEISNHARQTSSLSSNTHDDFEVTLGHVEYDAAETTHITSQDRLPATECNEDVTTTTSTRTIVDEEHETELTTSSQSVDASTSELLSHAVNSPLEDDWVATFSDRENVVSNEHSDELQNNATSATDVEGSIITQEFSLKEENTNLSRSVDRVYTGEVSVSEIETEKGHQSAPGSLNDDGSLESKGTMEEFQELSVPIPSDGDVTSSAPETNTTNNASGILEDDSTVMVKWQGRNKGRSLTLEEATDTILFCSSIVHDLAYEAATIAMEKESRVPLERLQPTIPISGKSNPERREARGRPGRRSSKPHKGRPKWVETDGEPPASKIENDENVDESMQRHVGLPNKVDGMKPPKLESKCNCTIM